MEGLFDSVEGVGLLIQAVGAVLVALLCAMLRRVQRHPALGPWTLAWSSLGIGLFALLVEQGVPATAPVLLPVYVFGEIGFGAALVVGCARFAEHPPTVPVRAWWLVPAALYAAILPQVVGTAFVGIFLAQSVLLTGAFGLSWWVLSAHRGPARGAGHIAMRGALGALTLLFAAYVPVFGAHAALGTPLPMTLLRLSSAAHLLLEFVLGFGAAVMVLEGAHGELDVANRQLRRSAERDELTGALNRRALGERLPQLLAEAAEGGRDVARFYLDIDHFKAINDRHGHGAGDRLLVSMAQRLQRCLRPEDLVVRMGGDEFVVVTGRSGGRDDAAALAARLTEALSAPVELAHGSVTVHASLGIARAPHDASTADELLECADLALYAVKAAGRNDHRFFDAETSAMKAAASASRRGLAVLFRPVMEMRSGRLVGLDAVSNGRAESGLNALRLVCAHLREWAADLLPQVPISLRVTLRQLQAEGFAAGAVAAVDDAGIDPALVRIDVDETTLEDGGDRLRATLLALDAAGLRLGLAGFGAGRAGLDALRRLPFTTLTLDRAFMTALVEAPRDATIASSVVQLAHRLGLGVIAADVETPAQAVALVSIGVDAARGPHFHEPLPAEAAARLLDFEGRRLSLRAAPTSDASRSPSDRLVADRRT